MCCRSSLQSYAARQCSVKKGHAHIYTDMVCVSCRKMYDFIIQCSPLLPSGVTLAEVLEGSSATDVKDIVASLPDTGTISAAAMITAGLPHAAV